MNSALNNILSRLGDVREVSGGWQALCPAHDDREPSLFVSEGDDKRILLKCFAGCSVNEICNALKIEVKDLYPNKHKFKVHSGGRSPVVAAYDYQDINGNLLFQVCRTENKHFFQRRPNGQGGWVNGLHGVKPVLYRLPEVVQAVEQGETIFIPEGEKDCDNLVALGLTATCNPMGAGKWRNHYSGWFKGAEVVILPDNDGPGKKHAQQVAKSLHGKVTSVKILELPNLQDKGDVTDWLSGGGTREELLRLAQDTPKWEPEPEGGDDGGEKEKITQADRLIQIAVNGAFLFHDETRDTFGNLPINGHKETWPLRSKFFKQWLVQRYYRQTGKSPNNEALRQALNVVEAMAIFDGPEIELSLRVAEKDGKIYYDLANAEWQAVRITVDGWHVIDNPPILFRRFKNTASQVLPKRGGSLELLKKYINLKDGADWQLLCALLIHALIPDVPHGIPVFYGDKGSAKTTAQRIIRKLIDPAFRDTLTLPTDKNEMALTLMTNYAPCFDNLDGLRPWQSDMLCQATTGGGISKRELYTDMDEVILSFLRCPMLNGINLVASRDDLLDRSVLFRLDRIGYERRKTESELWREFEQDRPYILGAMFDVLCGALKIYPAVNLPGLPRMADFARWGYAINEAIRDGGGNEFMKAYYQNIAGAVEEAVIGDIVGAALVEFMDGRESWEGTATELLELLNELPSVNVKEKAWPKRPHTLTRRINKIKAALVDYGIEVVSFREESLSRRRLLQLKNNTVHSVQSVQEASEAPETRDPFMDAIMDAIGRNGKVASNDEALETQGLDAMDALDATNSSLQKGAADGFITEEDLTPSERRIIKEHER